MSTQVSNQQPQRAQEGKRGRGGRRGGNAKRGGPRGGANPAVPRSSVTEDKQKVKQDQNEQKDEEDIEPVTTTVTTTGGEDGEEENVCWICAELVKYWSVSECNHRTCHVCALRLRALYKKTDCTFCKEPQPTVVFTASPDTEFSAYKPDDIPYKDAKLSIYFETPEMMEETLILLKFNCPDSSCDFIGNGWADLKLHTRAVHNKLMCDVCIRHKKVFSHEHALYPPNILPTHLPSMHHRYAKQVPPEKVEGGVHPICEFCRECFFGVDEHYSHMREKHEECFVCKRNSVQYQYFQNYDSLERHFNTAHHPCTQPVCRERKFVVFNTTLDLQAHMVEEHGAAMSTRDRKDARKVVAEFQFEEAGARPGRRAGPAKERDREPPPNPQPPRPPAEAGSSTTSRPSPGPSNSRRAAFGSSLTEGNAQQPPQQPRSGTNSPLFPDTEPAAAERHLAFLDRLRRFAPNPTNAVAATKAAIRSYRTSESSARDLILTLFNVLDNNLDHTASILNGLVDLLDEEEKKQHLFASWRGFTIERRQEFPDLLPQAIGGGYAAITSGRVLNAKKNATASRSRQVWDRVALAASSSSSLQPRSRTPQNQGERFPALQSSSSSSLTTLAAPALVPAFRQPTRTTPWSASATATTAPRVVEPYSMPGSSAAAPGKSKPPKLDHKGFPELPSANSARDKPKVSGNVSLKNILGNVTPPTSAWEKGSGPGSGPGGIGDTGPSVGGNGGGGNDTTEREGEGSGAGKKGKKGKGKQKQTLFTLGTFPS